MSLSPSWATVRVLKDWNSAVGLSVNINNEPFIIIKLWPSDKLIVRWCRPPNTAHHQHSPSTALHTFLPLFPAGEFHGPGEFYNLSNQNCQIVSFGVSAVRCVHISRKARQNWYSVYKMVGNISTLKPTYKTDFNDFYINFFFCLLKKIPADLAGDMRQRSVPQCTAGAPAGELPRQPHHAALRTAEPIRRAVLDRGGYTGN